MTEPYENPGIGENPADRRRCPWSVLVLALVLAGCGGPKFVPDAESGIELRWPRDGGSIDKAQADADARCQAHGLHAVLSDEFIDRDEMVARFRCRPV